MKKTTPPNSDRTNGSGKTVLSEVPSELVLSDRSPVSVPDAPDREQSPEEEYPELAGVPFLGPTRKRALAENGLRTISDLRAASVEQIGGVKGIGLGNAERIKGWLAAHAPASPDAPPPPPEIDTPPVHGLDPALAQDNASIFDGLSEIDALTASLRGSSDGMGASKKLERQFDKIAAVTSELAEAPDTLSPKRLQQAVNLLHRIVAVLQAAADRKRLSGKRQDMLAEELRDQRKALQKVLGE